MNKEFFEAIEQLEKEKGVSAQHLCEGIQRAIVTAVKRDYNNKDIVFCEIDMEKKKMKVYVRKVVVAEISDPDTDILVDAAQTYKKGAMVGDIIEIPLQTKDISRIAAEKGKHVLRQGIRDAERGQMIEEFQNRKQELETAKVQMVDANTGNIVLAIGKATLILPKSEQLPNETFKEGDLIKVYIVDVKESEGKLPRTTISRTHPGLVKKLFENEVPEIKEGLVEIVSVSREAGSRCKLAVSSKDENIDAVGSCIGTKGARVGKIVELLCGEKIEIVKYSEDPAEYIAASLAPADVVSVEIISEEERTCSVTVPDSQLSLAIGNKGQNARLAAKLTNWKIDIKPESGFFESVSE
ncbi:MAG: transcription termination/antitermination protein NusA [Clostridia bacterium]|nr:transcription termination/antitermination protein NusA [Clostridia bacterium]